MSASPRTLPFTTSVAVDRWLSAIVALPRGSHASIFDVGANDGKFTEALLQVSRRRAPHVSVSTHLFEPQPQFYHQLSALASRWNGSFYPAAAVAHLAGRPRGAGALTPNVTLYTSRNTMAASAIEGGARRYPHSQLPNRTRRHRSRRAATLSVRTVDLSEVLLAHVLAEERGLRQRAGRRGGHFPLLLKIECVHSAIVLYA